MSSWSTTSRAALISAVTIAVGCLFVSAYALALGDPMPRSIDAALVGNGAAHPQIVVDGQRVAGGSLIFRDYPSRPAAFHAIDLQQVYAALDLRTTRPTLYVASASGASVARVLEETPRIDPRIRVIDTHPLQRSDPGGWSSFTSPSRPRSSGSPPSSRCGQTRRVYLCAAGLCSCAPWRSLGLWC